MIPDNQPVYHVPFSRSGKRKKVVHLDPTCHHIKGESSVCGPKPKRILPGTELCSACKGENSHDGNDKRQVTRLLEVSDPEDIGLSPVGERAE